MTLEPARFFVLGNLVNAWFMHVDRLPVAGESLAARRVFHEFGGKGLNLGYGLHRLGRRVDMLLALGDDASGRAARQQLGAAGMDTGLFQTVDAETGFGVGFIAPDGTNFLAAHMGANALLDVDQVHAARPAIAAARWALAHFEVDASVVAETFRLAKGHGVGTYLNPSPWKPIPAEILALTDILVLNETEANLFLGLDGERQSSPEAWADRLVGETARTGYRGRLLVVTLADAGCVALDAEGRAHHVAAYPVAQVDATGAGDAFGCGLLDALARGAAIQDALRHGNACGAIVAAREGILAHLPDRAQVAALQASSP